MLNKILATSLKLFKNMIFNPSRVFQEIGKGEYDYSIFSLFFISGVITFFKSFGSEKYNINFFRDERINEIMSFLSIPQIKWFLTFLSFILFVLIIRVFCRFFLEKCNKRDLLFCFLSISSVGILLQIVFYILQYFIPIKSVYMLSHLAFFWIAYLSVSGIKNSQKSSYKKATIIYALAGLPVLLVIGLTGLAPFLLWIVSPVI